MSSCSIRRGGRVKVAISAFALQSEVRKGVCKEVDIAIKKMVKMSQSPRSRRTASATIRFTSASCISNKLI